MNERLGGYNSASILMQSFNFNDFRILIESQLYDDARLMLTGIAKNLESAGADCVLICANTPHMFAAFIQQNIGIPLIHIAEETGRTIQYLNLKKVALLGTKPTMELPFYKEVLAGFDIETLIPNDDDRNYIHHTIFEEFSKDIFTKEAKTRYINIIESLKLQGAEGVILGCTEIPILIHQTDVSIHAFDTIKIHCEAAINFAIKN